MASAAGAKVDLDVVTKVVTAYQELLDSHWTDTGCSLSHCVNASSSVFASSGSNGSQRGSSFGGSSKKKQKDPGENPKFTKAEADLLDLRDFMKKTGLPITSAKSEIHVAKADMTADGKVTVSVGVGTTKTYDDVENVPSYVVDTHTMTLAPHRENLFAVVEDIVDPWPVEDPSVGELENAPTDPPVETPFEALLGRTDGNSRQVSYSVDATFSLPVSRQQDDPAAGMHFVADDEYKQPVPDVTKMVDYAVYWTDPAVQPPEKKEDVINPEYHNLGANCANFASQALEAGGWKRKDGLLGSRDVDAWSPSLTSRVSNGKPSHTWSLARDLYTYAKYKGPYRPIANEVRRHEAAQPGDLIFTDWDNGKENGMGHPDGVIDHVMVVTGTSTLKEDLVGAHTLGTVTEIPRISQKSRNRNNRPITETYRTLQTDFNADPKQMAWYGLTLAYDPQHVLPLL